MSDTAQALNRRTLSPGAPRLLPAILRRVLVRPPEAPASTPGVEAPAPPRDAEPAAPQEQPATIDAVPSEPRTRARAGRLAGRWQQAGLIAILLLSAFLELFRLNREGNGNQYYTTTVFSMLQSWHTFFFASFDPGGFVTVDKPPLGFWIQAASAKLFEVSGLGFSGLSVLLPEALAAVASVAILYHLVRRAAGPVAGLLAALALAVMPISVVVSRNNTIDSLLVLTLLLAAWAAFRAAESGKLGWLLLAAATIGLGFEIKMLEAYLVAPAVFLLYLVAAPRARLTRIGHLALAGVVLVLVSFAWPVAVDLTPKDQRPYVGSTQNNSAVSLALGYNGVERLLGRGGSVTQVVEQTVSAVENAADGSGQQVASADDGATSVNPASNGGQPAPQDGGRGGPGGFGGGPGGPGGGGPGGFGENGTPGPLRLLNQQLAGQASWLLPLALLGVLVSGWAAWTRRRHLHTDRRAQGLVLWGTWLLTAGAFFSVAGYYHKYYLVMLGPPIAALAAIGVVGAWTAYRHSWRLGWLLPLALVATGYLQMRILTEYPEWAAWLTPIALGGASVAAALLVLVRLARRNLRDGSRFVLGAQAVAIVGTLALLAAPAVWSGLPSIAGQTVGGLPSAGPAGRGGPGGFPGGGSGGPPPFGGPGGAPNGGPVAGQFGGPGGGFAGGPPPGGFAPGGFDGGPRAFGGPGRDGGRPGGGGPGGPGGFGGPGGGAARADEIAYLQANQGSATFLVATTNANSAAPIILETGKPVMALGGFLGSDPILTTDQLAEKVQAGEVRFFLLDGRGGPGGFGGERGLSSWVQSSCAAVPASALGTPSDQSADDAANADGASGLYDCAPVQVGLAQPQPPVNVVPLDLLAPAWAS